MTPPPPSPKIKQERERHRRACIHELIKSHFQLQDSGDQKSVFLNLSRLDKQQTKRNICFFFLRTICRHHLREEEEKNTCMYVGSARRHALKYIIIPPLCMYMQ